MLLRARDNNIQSFAYTWLYKENQNESKRKSEQTVSPSLMGVRVPRLTI